MAAANEKQARGARTQSLFRVVNEQIEELSGADALRSSEMWEFACECSNEECTGTISLTVEEYEAIRRIPTHFAVTWGHNDPESERIVDETDRYIVVEKFGDGGMVAAELDPRKMLSEAPSRPLSEDVSSAVETTFR